MLELKATTTFPGKPFSLTCCRTIGLAQISWWRHGGHDQVEGDREVHSSHVPWPSSDHAYLVMGLEVHVGWTPRWKSKRHRIVLHTHDT